MLFIMQGVPGSGKTTLARKLAKQYNAVICSTDDFHFQAGDGVYRFEPENIGYYHAYNQFEVEYWLKAGRSVIVDNCNILGVHALPYIELARRYSQPLRVCRCDGAYVSVHGVPAEVIDRMRKQMEVLL